MGRLPALIAMVFIAIHPGLAAQNRLRADGSADLLKDPGGIKLATLVAGRDYAVGKTSSGHVEITVEGWVIATSTQPSSRDGFDLTVIAGGGENLRSAPGGALVARLQEGTLLNRVGTRGGWIRVRRVGWVPRGALSTPPPAVAAGQPSPPPPNPSTAVGAGSTTAARPDTVRPPVGTPISTLSLDDSTGSAVSDRATLRDGAALSLTPDGIPVGQVTTSAEVEVVGRTGDWVRVRVEGWIRLADVAAESPAAPQVTAAMLLTAPERYVGQTISWRLQFLAVQEADALRPEMPLGQLYVLARGPLPESGFAYVMVTKDQAAQFRQLAPLDEVRIEAIIRAGRTRYLPTPVLELLKVVR